MFKLTEFHYLNYKMVLTCKLEFFLRNGGNVIGIVVNTQTLGKRN